MPARTFLAVALVLALALGGCFGDDTPLVETAEVVTAEVTETISAPARVEAAAREDVSAAIAGTVADIDVRDGDAVSAGDIIVRLDSPQVDQALAEAEEALAALEETPDVQAAAELPSIGAVPQPANPLEGVVAELDAAVAPQLEAARRALEQVPEIPDEVTDALPEDAELPSGGLAGETAAALEALESTYQGIRQALIGAGEAAVAQQRELSAQMAASMAEAQGALDEALASVNAQITEAQRAQVDATLAQVEAQEEALEVEAPISGVVELSRGPGDLPGFGAFGDLGGLGGLPEAVPEAGGDTEGPEGVPETEAIDGPLTEGADVMPGQPLFTVLDQSEWYVSADVDEVDATAVAEGQEAVVLIDAFPGEEFRGVVESVALTAETGLTGGVAYPTRIRLLDAPEDPSPRVGMTASVEIATATVEADLAVPARAVVRRDVGTAVYAVRDDVAELVPVEVVAQGEDLTAVSGDVEVGEQVVVSGYEDLADGSRVRIE